MISADIFFKVIYSVLLFEELLELVEKNNLLLLLCMNYLLFIILNINEYNIILYTTISTEYFYQRLN